MASTSNDLLLAEADLIYRLQCHEEEALKDFYKQYATALFGIILRIVKDDDTAEDILQESILRIWNSIGNHAPAKGQLFIWASNISRNLAIDTFRKGNLSSKTNNITDTLSSKTSNTYTKLNQLQISLLRLFEHGISDEEILELRQVMVAHMSQKLLEEVERVNEERGYTAADVEAMLNDPS